ncbi:MAG: GGDEF domain-containing protein [Devosia sp.]
MRAKQNVSLDNFDLSVSRADAVLALLERSKVAPLPVFYRLLYDYVAGVQSLASGRIGEIVADTAEAKRTAGERLYEEFVRPYADDTTAATAIDRMVRRLKTLDETLVATSAETREQSRSLGLISAEMDSDGQHLDLLREWVGRLSHANACLIEANSNLRAELDVSSAELKVTKSELAQLSRDSLIDPLTGISNRAGLDVALSTSLAAAEKSESSFALAVLDVDRFKGLNDTCGHLAGDEVLRIVARTLLASVRTGDAVGRLGGDEFIAILHGASVAGARVAAEKIREEVLGNDVSKILGPDVLGGVTVSIGVAQFQPGDTIVSMFARADRCLLEAKQNGRNRVVCEDDDDTADQAVA